MSANERKQQSRLICSPHRDHDTVMIGLSSSSVQKGAWVILVGLHGVADVVRRVSSDHQSASLPEHDGGRTYHRGRSLRRSSLARHSALPCPFPQLLGGDQCLWRNNFCCVNLVNVMELFAVRKNVSILRWPAVEHHSLGQQTHRQKHDTVNCSAGLGRHVRKGKHCVGAQRHGHVTTDDRQTTLASRLYIRVQVTTKRTFNVE